MDGLAVNDFPEGGAFVVGEGVEERFAEGGVGVERWGRRVEKGWGGGTTAPAGAVVVMVAPAGWFVRARRRGVGGRGGGRAGAFGFEPEGLGDGVWGAWWGRGGGEVRGHCEVELEMKVVVERL